MTTAPGEPIAFPGAEGFGKYSSGGRGGKVFIVSNLNDRGPGSFREAAIAKEKRMIVFAVAGTIHLETKLTIAGNCSIAGQSAPGDGICIADQPVGLGGDNIIVRFMRFRMGDKYQNKGMVDGSGSDDAFGGIRRKNIVIDHCSFSWSSDEVLSVYAGDSTSIQWNIISEPLNYSYHFEKGDTDFEKHGYGGIWGGRHLSAHHNLFAHCNSRTPRFDGTRNAPEENVDFRNNVIYNWGGNNVYAGEAGQYNIVANYYKYGPETKPAVKFRIVNPFKKMPENVYGKFYVQDNFVDGSEAHTIDNWKGVDLEKGDGVDKSVVRLPSAFTVVGLKNESALSAYQSVLQWAGCSMPGRDTLDNRIINDVRMREGKFIDVQGGYPHGTAFELTVNAWPALRIGTKSVDSDSDGMPDAWEKKEGLKVNDASDASEVIAGTHYSNIERYLNSLVK
jgi:hypothetical protein